jgi:hypothetical protein
LQLARDSREVKKWKAARRAQFRLKQTFDRIDWEEDVLGPEVNALMSGDARAEIGLAEDVIEGIVITDPE